MAAKSISRIGWATRGVTLMRFDEGVKIVGVARTVHEEDSGDGEDNPVE